MWLWFCPQGCVGHTQCSLSCVGERSGSSLLAAAKPGSVSSSGNKPLQNHQGLSYCSSSQFLPWSRACAAWNEGSSVGSSWLCHRGGSAFPMGGVQHQCGPQTVTPIRTKVG